MGNKIYDNEKWWQEHGFEWLQEIDKRRLYQPLYGVQEVVLSEYMSHLPEGSKVLEFGAGFGRHANYLSELNNIEYYAVDQSPTMLDALKVYTNNKLPEERIQLIEPRQRLPYPDNYFDVVYTVSVLIHINPEHIGEIIQELKRVAKHAILHFENKYTKQSELHFTDHDGCWKHAVQNLYEKVEIVDNLAEDQTLYIVKLDDAAEYNFTLNTIAAQRLGTMESNLSQGIKQLEGEAGWRQEALVAREEKIQELEGEVGWRQEALVAREEKIQELEGEVGWRQEALVTREEKLQELEGEVGWRQEVLVEREEKIEELEGEVGWRQEALVAREEKIQELEGEVGWRQEALVAREEKIQELEGEIGWRQEALVEREEAIEKFKQKIAPLEEQVKTLQQKLLEETDSKNELLNKIFELETLVANTLTEKEVLCTTNTALTNEINEIYSSNTWKLGEKLKSNKVLRWGGKKVIGCYKKFKHPVVASDISGEVKGIDAPIQDAVIAMFKDQVSKLEGTDTIALTHVNWMGVKNSTKELYGNTIEVEEFNSYQQVVEIGNEILKHDIKKVIFSGFAAGWNTLCTYLKEQNSDIKIVIFWHGNTTHMYEDYSWVRYQEILQLSKDQHIDKVAFAKDSMCTVYEKMGINVGMLNNHVERIVPDEQIKRSSKDVDLEALRVGIYSSGGTWNKNAYTQIAAASLFDNATVSMVPYNDRMKVFASQMNLKVTGVMGSLTRDELLKEMMKNDVNFYVTFSECAPLVPLESMNCGVLCLTGNNHHYFKGTELEKFLVVDRPDDPVAIYNKAKEALANKDYIMKLYAQWYEANRLTTQESIEKI